MTSIEKAKAVAAKIREALINQKAAEKARAAQDHRAAEIHENEAKVAAWQAADLKRELYS